MNTIKLTPPMLNASNIRQHITCIRPKRVGGPRIEQEIVHNKLMIHNYGHGGFGWTLLPGSVLHSINLLEETIEQSTLLNPSKKVTIVGAGCMGLLTALLLHERCWQVTIIADQTASLTSHKAAGSSAVIAIKASQSNQPLMDQIAIDSYRFYQKAITTKDPLFSGIKQLRVYMIHDGTPDYRFPLIHAGLMQQPEEVIIDFGKTAYKAKEFDTFFIETTIVMQNFMDKVIALKIPIINKKIMSFDEIEDSIVFNCTGLGARSWDKTLIVPVQGHMVMMQNQSLEGLQYIIYAHIKIDGKMREISWTPKNGGMLGGTAFNFQDKLDINLEQSNTIIERARKFFGNHE